MTDRPQLLAVSFPDRVSSKAQHAGESSRAGTGRRTRSAHAAALLSLVAAVAYLYAPAFVVDWHNLDEMLLLLQAQQFSPRDYFFEPDVYRLLSPANLTPWATLSFDFDLTQFGLDVDAFRLHTILDIAVVSCLSYLFFSRWSSPALAWIAALVFASSTPIAYVSMTIPSRHYIEGGIFAILALHLYGLVGRCGRRWPWIWASALLYAIAVTAKEVFVPLVVVLLAIDSGSWRGRLLRIGPHACVAALYCGWRYFMLDSLVGGYGVLGVTSDARTWSEGGWFLLRSAPEILLMWPPASVVLAGTVLALIGVAIARRQLQLVGLAALFVCVWAPVAPVGVLAMLQVSSGTRYFLVPLWASCLAFAFCVSRLSSRKLQILYAGVALVCALASAAQIHGFIATFHRDLTLRLESCVGFALHSPEGSVLDLPESLFLSDSIVAATHLNAYRNGTATEVVAGPLALPENFDARALFVQTAEPACFTRSDERRSELRANARRAEPAPEVAPELTWNADQLLWNFSALPPSQPSLVIRSRAGSLQRATTGQSGVVYQLRQKIWLHRVREPAEAFFVWSEPDGKLRHTRPVAVPSRYFAFWQKADG